MNDVSGLKLRKPLIHSLFHDNHQPCEGAVHRLEYDVHELSEYKYLFDSDNFFDLI